MIIRQIRKKLYLERDGVNADSLRKKGINYKTILGVPVVTLRRISNDFVSDAALADILWREDHREMKILATLIQNPESFFSANAWVNDIENLELAEQASANLFCKLPDADRLACEWIQSPQFYVRICGFLLYTRLFMQNRRIDKSDLEIYFHAVCRAFGDESMLLKNIALNSLKRLGRQSVLYSNDILARFESFPFYDDLKFEFEYYT